MSRTTRVLVTGSREWPDRQMVWDELTDAYENQFSGSEKFIVVHGGARGVDRMAGQWCWRNNERVNVRQEIHGAKWHENGVFVPSAGHQRNQRMVNLGADLVLAFIYNNSPGATGCMRAAMRAGLDVRVLRINSEESK